MAERVRFTLLAPIFPWPFVDDEPITLPDGEVIVPRVPAEEPVKLWPGTEIEFDGERWQRTLDAWIPIRTPTDGQRFRADRLQLVHALPKEAPICSAFAWAVVEPHHQKADGTIEPRLVFCVPSEEVGWREIQGMIEDETRAAREMGTPPPARHKYTVSRVTSEASANWRTGEMERLLKRALDAQAERRRAEQATRELIQALRLAVSDLERAGMSKAEIGRRLGISRERVSAIIKGVAT